ncbi:hypothetical protein R1sor_020701 [Riccia sorocarpa]|uniref:Coenzyme Q-binding protein COQ10 START domain-containing protein n=1 Tax=Riccia sorocarpa TaxID=122646 RepID=A0ABD3GEX4_9MARC
MEGAEQEASSSGTTPEDEVRSKWKAGVQVPVNIPIEYCWAVFANFANPQQFMTECLECKIVEGEPNTVNSVRYVRYPNVDGSQGTLWANERLLSSDHEHHIQTYKTEDNSFGFTNYETYLQVHKGSHDTSFVTWSIEMDPLPGMTPPPNPVTKLITDTFRIFIRNVESRYFQEKRLWGGEKSSKYRDPRLADEVLNRRSVSPDSVTIFLESYITTQFVEPGTVENVLLPQVQVGLGFVNNEGMEFFRLWTGN